MKKTTLGLEAINSSLTPSNAIFMATLNNEYTEVLKLCDNGDIFVKGKLIYNDKEVAEVIIEFFKKSRLF